MGKLTVQTRKGVASFRRCGIDFFREPKTVEVDDEQEKIIRAEGRLEVVAQTKKPAADSAPAKKATPKARPAQRKTEASKG